MTEINQVNNAAVNKANNPMTMTVNYIPKIEKVNYCEDEINEDKNNDSEDQEDHIITITRKDNDDLEEVKEVA